MQRKRNTTPVTGVTGNLGSPRVLRQPLGQLSGQVLSQLLRDLLGSLLD